MSNPGYGTARHLSIVWAVTLAILTLLEWRNLDRDPLEREILSPFIQREITMSRQEDSAPIDRLAAEGEDFDVPAVRYEVEFHFNGPLFLLCFFGPVALFYGIAQLLARIRRR